MTGRHVWHRGAVAALLALVLGAPPASAGDRDFSVTVTLSPKAAALLAARKEKIVVAAYYGGVPLPAYQNKADEEGQIDLGQERVTLSGTGGKAAFSGATVLRQRLGWVKEARILINVFSARLSNQFNLLDCGIFEGTFPEARAQPIAISCKLIKGE